VRLILLRTSEKEFFNQELESIEEELAKIMRLKEMSPRQRRRFIEGPALEEHVHRTMYQLNELKKRCLFF
jgi:hypothetical protein